MNKLFSYGIDEDELWVFDTENRLWDVPENVEYLYPANRLKRHLNHNMQLAVYPTQVFMIGGSLDENLNEISNELRSWSLIDNKVRLKAPMLYFQFDFSVCIDKHLISCVGGCASWSNSSFKP